MTSLFNKHPDVFYIPDLLIMAKPLDNKKTRLQLLQNYFDACSIPRLTQYDNGPLKKYLLRKNINCVLENICFREKMEIFRKAPICKDHKDNSNTNFNLLDEQNIDLIALQQKCPLGENDIQTAEKICTTKIVRAAKVMRLHDMQELPKHFINTKNYKIIYLVRDPRGLIASRLQVMSEKECPDCIINVCNEWNHFLANKDTIFKYWKNLMIVRYEDFVVNPEAWTKIIYDFIGIQNHIDIHSYLEAIVKSEQGELSQYSKLTKYVENSKIRDPKKRAFSWVNTLSWRVVDKVQRHCQAVFENFGYIYYRDEKELRNSRKGEDSIVNYGNKQRLII